MRAHPFLVVLTCVLALALGSCDTGKGVSNGSTHGTLRVVNVIPNAGGPLNVTFDLKPFVAGLPFEGMTQYQTIDAGTREVQVSVAGSSTNLIDVTPIFLPDVAYTFVAFGALANATGIILNDTLIVDPGAGNFALRVVNGASNNGGIDVYVTAPGEDLNTVSPSIAGVGYGTTSLFVNLPVGNREIRDHHGQLQAGHLRRAGAGLLRARPRPGDRLFARQQYAGQCRLSQPRRHRHRIDRQQLARPFQGDQRLIGRFAVECFRRSESCAVEHSLRGCIELPDDQCRTAGADRGIDGDAGRGRC